MIPIRLFSRKLAERFLFAGLLMTVGCSRNPEVRETSTLIPTPSFGGEEGKTGGVDGGGGRAMVCRDAGGAILKVEMLDLYEGPVQFGLKIQRSEAPYQQQVKDLLSKLPQSAGVLHRAFVESAMKAFYFLPSGTQISLINDSMDIVFPQGCAAEQLAHYQSDQRIIVDSDLWAHLAESDRAALVLHEGIYAVNRLMGARDSRYSRLLVAKLFTPDLKFEEVLDDAAVDSVNCVSPDGPLFLKAYQGGGHPDQWTLTFAVLGEMSLPTRTTADVYLHGFDFRDLKQVFRSGTDLIGTGIQVASYTTSAFGERDLLQLSLKWTALKDQSGSIVPGYQTLTGDLEWRSGTFQSMQPVKRRLNCTVEMGL